MNLKSSKKMNQKALIVQLQKSKKNKDLKHKKILKKTINQRPHLETTEFEKNLLPQKKLRLKIIKIYQMQTSTKKKRQKRRRQINSSTLKFQMMFKKKRWKRRMHIKSSTLKFSMRFKTIIF